MSRVDDNRDVQQAIEKRRQEDVDREKTRQSAQSFSQVISQKREVGRKNSMKQGQEKQAQGQTQKSAASSALLAHRGIQGKDFQSELQQRGDASRSDKQVQSKVRDTDAKETKRSEESQGKGEQKKVEQQGDRLAAISRDDRGKRGEGDGGGGSKDSGAGGDKLPGQGGPIAEPLAQQVANTNKTQGAAQTRLPADVLQSIVDKVFVGMNKQGLSEFHIQFKDDVLAGSSLKLSAKNGQVSATFTTTNANVKRLIQSSEGELARAFSNKGLQLSRLEVVGP